MSKVVPLDYMGMHRKKECKGRRNVKEGGKTGDGER